jgi:hypothetical protein
MDAYGRILGFLQLHILTVQAFVTNNGAATELEWYNHYTRRKAKGKIKLKQISHNNRTSENTCRRERA